MCHKNEKAFTLIELLVVISIIALLMAILMPITIRAKNEAKSILCRAKLRDWGFYFYLYTSDNNGHFACTYETILSRIVWVRTMKPYYEDDPKRILCPMAKKPAYPTPDPVKCVGSKFKAWGRWVTEYDKDNTFGSYGINSWVYNQPRNKQWHGHDTDCNWKNIYVKGAIAATVPLFLDCVWVAASPENDDKPPKYDDQICIIKRGQPNMQRFCIDRHNGYINGTFLDFSVRKVGLKELWRLKWHREFDTTKTLDWSGARWMRKFRDY